ncbi:hypothetical protein [Streptomyces zaomyceticus]|uniref:hypothetical protein n=1 Tax=Streptomyces zaomyceticus TaxID=68286 RepID=UPI002E134CB5|nr:hypothetical protein OG237_02480 [Streptomyces zaomyceticus]
MTQGLNKLKDVPQFAEMGAQLRGEELDAGRQAFTAAANRKPADLADSLHERTLAIGSGRDQEDEEEPEAEPEKPRRRRSPRPSTGSRSETTGSSRARKAPQGRDTASSTKKASPAKKAAARKSATRQRTNWRTSPTSCTTSRRTVANSPTSAGDC